MKHFVSMQIMIGHLNKMCTNTQLALVERSHWWAWGPFFCRKFLNQCTSLEFLLTQPHPVLDVSSVWTLVRSLYETHAVYYHLFIPCDNIEENVLRFRLWELDSTRSLLKFKRQHIEEEISEKTIWLTQNEDRCVQAIKGLTIFNSLSTKAKETLLKRPNWKMTLPNPLEKVSYDTLIKNTGIKETHFQDMYDYTSMHVHPSCGGIRQNLGLEQQETDDMKYTAVMQVCFVTSFFIMDLKKRYAQAEEYFNNLPEDQQRIIKSFQSMARSQ